MGLAHFLEHMLFMGSKKYKDEDHYFKKLKEYGGSSNAYTDDTYTVYYFDILSDNLDEVIDIFSRFFIDPLFNINAVSREINAVNSEHFKNFNNDSWVLKQIINNITKKDHIINRFGTGSHKTLGSNIEKLRDAMIDFYNKYYCANNMCITIQSSKPINEIEKMIKNCFGDIKQKKVVHPTIPISKFNSFNNEYHLITVDDVNTINYIWEVPEYKEFKDNKIVGVINAGIKFNCKNNLENYLIENDLASNISINYFDCGLLLLSIEIIPNKPKEIYYKINDIVRYYFNHLKYFNWDLIYDYNIKKFELNSNNKVKENNADLAMNISLNMHIFDEKYIYFGNKIIIKKEYTKLMNVLEYLKFDKVNIIYGSKNKMGSKYKKDKYYEKNYCKLNKSLINNESTYYNFDICINSDIINIEPKVVKHLDKYNIPKKLAPNFWYGGVSKFNETSVIGEICIQSNKYFNNKISLLTTLISINIINYYLNLLFRNEIDIGYNISMTLSYRNSAISLLIIGFNDKYVNLFNKVVEEMININPTNAIIKSNKFSIL
jgi:insulysin